MKTRVKQILSILPAIGIIAGIVIAFTVQPIAKAAGTLIIPEMVLPAGLIGTGVAVLVIIWRNHF